MPGVATAAFAAEATAFAPVVFAAVDAAAAAIVPPPPASPPYRRSRHRRRLCRRRSLSRRRRAAASRRDWGGRAGLKFWFAAGPTPGWLLA